MHTGLRLTVLAAVVAVAAGCATGARQPTFTEAQVQPAEVHIGETATLSVRLHDPEHRVERVAWRVPGAGQEDLGDEVYLERQDGGATSVWSRDLEFDFTAAEGEYEVEIVAYDANGEVVVTRGADGFDAPLTTSTRMFVVLPDDTLDFEEVEDFEEDNGFGMDMEDLN